jgi:hypothetical protein
MRAADGRPLGTSIFCVKTRQRSGNRTVETGNLTSAFQAGTIVTRARFVHVSNGARWPSETITASGPVIRATGRYRGRHGSLTGSGTIRPGPTDAPVTRLHLRIRLS